VKAVAGACPARLLGIVVPLGTGVSGWVAAHQRPIRNANSLGELGGARGEFRSPPRSCLSVPLSTGSTLVGVLTILADRAEAFTDHDEQMAQLIARQLAAAFGEALRQGEPVRAPVRRSVLRAV
jgi:GAF domain-containing protein